MDLRRNRIDLLRPDAPDGARRGPFGVGVRQLRLVNPGQVDVLDPGLQRTDRALDVEFWYPSAATGAGCRYETVLRDGHRPVVLHGSALRDAAPEKGDFPLVIVSHGYPGNRFLMAHFGEHLASHGYRVASIDHRDSTYDDPAYLAGRGFGSTLLNRPLDQRFVAQALGGDWAVIGYSMGGYGALISGGAGISPDVLTHEAAPPGGLLERHIAPEVNAALRAVVAVGPWGRQHGVWNAEGLATLRLPLLVVAGDQDAISDFEGGIRPIFEQAGGPRWMLTYHGAGHNAGAPIPAPDEAWEPSPHLDFPPFEHYGDKVWDNVRMNNIAQHFVLDFLDLHLKGVAGAGTRLGPGWSGFPEGHAPGLSLQRRG